MAETQERLCKNCQFWQWNGAPFNPRIGYCTKRKWVYRKETQYCSDKFKPTSWPNKTE